MENTIITGASGELEINNEGKIKVIPGPYTYKSGKRYQELEDNEIAYISESYLGDLEEDHFYSKDELLKICTECTKKQLVDLCREQSQYDGLEDNEEFIQYIAEDIYDNAEWASFSTYLDQLDLVEQLEYFKEDSSLA